MDSLCSQVGARPNDGYNIPFATNDQYLVRLVESTREIVVPQSLANQVLHLSHHVKLGATREERICILL